jgi:hypothetical protein
MNDADRINDWHHRPLDQIAAHLTTALEHGLTDDEVATRRAVHGENRITAVRHSADRDAGVAGDFCGGGGVGVGGQRRQALGAAKAQGRLMPGGVICAAF